AEVHFDFVPAASEHGRAAAGTEKAPAKVACFPLDRHRILRKHGGRVEKGAVMFAAIETMTKADAVWRARRHNSHVAAQATARESFHPASPNEPSPAPCGLDCGDVDLLHSHHR